MSLTDAQRNAAFAPCDAAVIAGAGAGKTHMLAERYAYLVNERGLSPLKIVAVTFTEKAADELRARVRRRLTESVNDEDTLAQLEAAPIKTIHGLAAQLCRQYPEEASVPIDFSILDEVEGLLWRRERIESILLELPADLLEALPYRVLRAVIDAAQADPYSVRQALRADSAHWPDLVRRAREDALSRILEDPRWKEIRVRLESGEGPPSDGLEIRRRQALAAMAHLQRGETESALDTLGSINLRGGSKKAWDGLLYSSIHDAVKNLRDWIKKENDCALLSLQLTEIDDQLRSQLPFITQLVELICSRLDESKRAERVLDYNDLEIGALRALDTSMVRDACAQRWKAVLIDEFQDTNPIQGEIIKRLWNNVILTIVGDANQSIYGFRRADVEVFERFQKSIVKREGERIVLNTSFRSHHEFVDVINRLFAPLLGKAARVMEAHRIDAPHSGPHVRAFVVEKGEDSRKADRIQIEANSIAERIDELLSQGMQVFDPGANGARPVRPGDFAILSRTWAPLEIYGEALAVRGIPVAAAGGGDLLETREAKDASMLLRFLADPMDNLALAAVLRSPFFAVSDQALFHFAQSLDGQSWWEVLRTNESDALRFARDVLSHLLECVPLESPSDMLRLADEWTGYTAVLAGLPHARRRDADWRGMVSTIAAMEAETGDLFGVVRRLKHYLEAEARLERPPIECGDAVALMTIHAAKGLEWPIVIVPDLARRPNVSNAEALFDPELGFAVRWEDESGEKAEPALFRILDERRKRKDEAESMRLFYVACTRARDALLLTSTDEKGGIMDSLIPALRQAGVDLETIPYVEEHALPPAPRPPESQEVEYDVLLGDVGVGLFELPATALSVYERCPKRFHYQFVEGRPGSDLEVFDEGHGARIGQLTHRALELGVRDLEALAGFDPTLPKPFVRDALKLASAFDEHPVFSKVRERARGRERPVMLAVDGMIFHGIVDVLGPDFVLDYKTDRDMQPDHHRFQLWVYAEALKSREAYIAYLRHEALHRFGEDELRRAGDEASERIRAIQAGLFEAKPDAQGCYYCPYRAICSNRFDAGENSPMR